MIHPKLKNIIIAEDGVKLYTILKRDTLWDIAERYTGSGDNYKKIARLNNISNPNLIYTGTTIKIPVKTSTKKTKTLTYRLPTKYILKPKEEKLKVPLYEWKLPESFVPQEPKQKTDKDKKIKVSSSNPLKNNKKSTNDTRVTHDYYGNSTSIISPKNNSNSSKTPVINSPIGNFFRNLYHRIPEDYRAPIDLLRSGNILGLASYINTAYDRKISDDYKGVKVNTIKVQKAKETPKYRLSEPSTFDVKQASPLKRTGILGRSISYMNVPYDLNVKDYKWHYRQRGDMSPVQHTYGILAPIFENMTTKEKAKHYSGIIFNPETGQLSVEPDLNKVPDGWLVNDTYCIPIQVKGMKKDENGNLIMVHPGGEYRNNYTALYDTVSGMRRSPNVFTNAHNPDPRTLGAKAGGHFIISADPEKGNRQVRLIHGSLQNLSDAIDRLKTNTGVDYVTVYPLDGGSFSMGYIPLKAVGLQDMQWTTIESNEFNRYQNQNSRGSSGFMPVERLPEIPDTTYITTTYK